MVKVNKWKSVKLEGPIISGGLDGLIGIEELSTYDENIILKKRKDKKRKLTEPEDPIPKKTKDKNKIINKSKTIEPGAFVRAPNISIINTESKQKDDNIIDNIKTDKKAKNKKKIQQQKNETKKQKVEIGVTIQNNDEEKCTIEDLTAWSLVPLPDPLLQGLADLGFTKPTMIQELTLPPAILGRRDILGAAETGSGKTLAFGLPILAGILKLKEEDEAKNQIEIDDNNSDISEDLNSETEEQDSDLEEEIEGNDSESSDEDNNSDESNADESDFEEREEVVKKIGKNGIGCVRSIDNIKFDDDNETVIKMKPTKPLYALILTPTRELAIQVKNHLIAAAKYTDIQIAVILGGMAAVKQERILNKSPEIVVATPGRLWELIQEGNRHLSQVDNIRYLAIDETDRMVEKYHFKEFHHLLERINMDETKRKQRQNFVFSATLTLVHDLPQHLQKKKQTKMRNSKKIHKLTPAQKLAEIIEMLGISDPKVVDVTQEKGTATSLTECRINCPIEEKDYYVYYFLQRHPGRTLIFCNSIGCVKRLATLLSILGCSSLPLHASMQQRQRLKNLERFRDDINGVLVATDVAARGLDIPKVDHVLHYQTPRTSESYVHRSGRTARASEEGITVLLIEPNEVTNYLKLCHTLGRTHDLPSFPIQESLLNAVKQRVNLARDLDKLELQSRRTSSETGWLQKAAQDMDMILDEDDFGSIGNIDKEEVAQTKHLITWKRKELASLIKKPIFPKGFSIKYPTSSGEINIPLVQGDQSKKSAVDVMKTAIENSIKVKSQKPRKLFKKKENKSAKIDKKSKPNFKTKNKKFKKNKK